ncbi:MAG TPA: APC family permease [Micromonosporaceae bacterium]|jgi:amino acid transporter|nr:APC family permease [Micromonosporaceae bacterium]
MRQPHTEIRRGPPRIPLRHGEGDRSRLGVVGGLAALSPDALSSVAYGPEAIVAALVVAGSAAVALALPVVIALAVLLLVLVISYCQVIAAFPDGGGAYAVAKATLGGPVAMVAAASLVVDYVLTAAVGLAAGAEALASAFPALQQHLLPACLAGLFVLTALNLWGIAESARVLMVPIMLFIVVIFAIIIGGLVVHHASTGPPVPARPGADSGFILVLKAFAAGCVALTGVEAIANGVPAFRDPRARRAQHTEITLGVILVTMLLGIAVVVRLDHLVPVPGLTLLAQIAASAYGHGVLYKVMMMIVTLVLALAANTSFGGLPVLLSLVAKDSRAPHLFALRAERPVYRVGVTALAIAAGLLLIVSDGRSAKLLPLYAIGVFVGFTISQTGMVRRLRPDRRWVPLVTCAIGAVLTFVTTFVLLITKFVEGAWIVLIAIPVFVLLFAGTERYYRRLAHDIALDDMPRKPTPVDAVVIVPVADVSRVTRHALDMALGLGRPVTAVSVKDDDGATRFRDRWTAWAPDVPLDIINDPYGRIIDNVVEYACEARSRYGRVIVVVPRIRTRHRWQQIMHNQRTLPLAGRLLAHYGISVCAVEYDVADRRV